MEIFFVYWIRAPYRGTGQARFGMTSVPLVNWA